MEPQQKQSNGRVLLADDDEQFRLGLGLRLIRAGFDCDYADGASAVVQMLQDNDYHALVSDINMPGNSSLEMLEEIPSIADGLPVILLTGRPTVETAAKSVRLRVTAYLIKPPDFEELCSVLHTSIAEYRSIKMLKDQQRRLQDWGMEVERMLRLMEQGGTTDRQSTLQSYLRLSLRNLAVGIIELEHLLVEGGKEAGSDVALEKQDLLKCIQKTVAVLGETRSHFKSKALGELRKELEQLLNQRSR